MSDLLTNLTSDLGSPTFVITNAGLAAAAIASPTGPWISIVEFQIGSGYGYTPEPTDLGLDGALLYTGTPTSYQNAGGNTLDILCEIPPDSAPFQFGEVALMLPGGVMFAKAVFPTLQTKFSSLGSNVASSYELNCLLTLAQGTAIFQISTIVPTTLLQMYNWSDIYPPSLSPNPSVPLLQVMELSEFGDSTLLSNSSSGKWSIESSTYQRYSQNNDTSTFSVANASSTWVEIAATELNPLDLTTVNERFVVETPDNYFRSVNSVVVSGSNYRFNFNGTPLQTVPAVGSSLTVYRDDQAQGTSYYSSILDPLYYDKTMLSTNTGTVNAYAATYKQKNPVPYEGMIRSLDVGTMTNTGASTFACDGGTPYPIVGQADQPLQGDEINGAVTLRFSAANSQWLIQNSAYGALQIPNALHSQQAVTLGQVEAGYQPLGDYVTGGSGYAYELNWNGNLQAYVNGTYVGNLWTSSNFNPLVMNGIGYVAFIVLYENASQSAPEGTIMALPGRPGTWLSSGWVAAAQDYWCVWTRIA